MTHEITESTPATAHEPSRMNRRELGKRGAMLGVAAGAAWTAPVVFDSFSNPAAAAGTSLVNSTTPGVISPPVTIPANRTASFTIIGGGGAGGWYQAFNGGSATKIVGRISPTGSSRTVTVTVGQGARPHPPSGASQREAPGTPRAVTRAAERAIPVAAEVDPAPSCSGRLSLWSHPGVPAPGADPTGEIGKGDRPDLRSREASTRDWHKQLVGATPARPTTTEASEEIRPRLPLMARSKTQGMAGRLEPLDQRRVAVRAERVRTTGTAPGEAAAVATSMGVVVAAARGLEMVAAAVVAPLDRQQRLARSGLRDLGLPQPLPQIQPELGQRLLRRTFLGLGGRAATRNRPEALGKD